MAKQKKKSYTSIEEELEELGSKLTEKQLAFCEYFLPTLNATTSYKKAYNVPYKSASSLGSRTLANVKVKAYIACMKRLRASQLDIHQEDILEMYKKIAFADMTDYIDFQQVEGTMRNTEENYDASGGKTVKTEEVPFTYTKFAMMPSEEVDGTVITELQRGKDGVFKVKLADKMQALKFLSNYTNMLNDDEIKKLQAAKLSYEVENLKNGVNVNAAQITIVNSWDGESDETDN